MVHQETLQYRVETNKANNVIFVTFITQTAGQTGETELHLKVSEIKTLSSDMSFISDRKNKP